MARRTTSIRILDHEVDLLTAAAFYSGDTGWQSYMRRVSIDAARRDTHGKKTKISVKRKR